MALTVDELIDEQGRLLPAEYAAVPEVLALYAGALAEAGEAADGLLLLAKIGSASGKWLELTAHTYGLRRQAGETDSDLIARIRNYTGSVTVVEIEATVNALLAPYTGDLAFIVEHFTQGPALDTETGPPLSCVCDAGSWLWDRIRGFTLYVPISLPSDDPIWAAIFAEVERSRAAGVWWAMIYDDEPVTTYP